MLLYLPLSSCPKGKKHIAVVRRGAASERARAARVAGGISRSSTCISKQYVHKQAGLRPQSGPLPRVVCGAVAALCRPQHELPAVQV
jgi:hypothetical protein